MGCNGFNHYPDCNCGFGGVYYGGGGWNTGGHEGSQGGTGGGGWGGGWHIEEKKSGSGRKRRRTAHWQHVRFTGRWWKGPARARATTGRPAETTAKRRPPECKHPRGQHPPMTTCPHCGCPVRTDHLPRHLKRVHHGEPRGIEATDAASTPLPAPAPASLAPAAVAVPPQHPEIPTTPSPTLHPSCVTMPVLYISTPGTRVSLVSERLRIQPPAMPGEDAAPAARDIPFAEIDQLVLHDSASVSLQAMTELLRRDIPIVLLRGGHRVAGLCLPPAIHSAARVAQYRRADDPAFTLRFARETVAAKILNGRRVLQRLAANRPEAEITPTLLAMNHLAEEALAAASIDTLRGYEGTSAGRYFEAFASLFPPELPFERRSRRPPHNPPNAVLSFAYTLLASEAEAALHLVGLDPAIGFYHTPADRRAALALDLIEPFRAPLADAMAIDLFSHGTLNPKSHFHPRDGGIYLNEDGRKRFFVAFERRMEREFTSEQHGARTTLRREILTQCRSLKKAILDGSPHEPFRMN